MGTLATGPLELRLPSQMIDIEVGDDPPSFSTVTTAMPSMDLARELARSLVENRLAACAHLVAAESVYRWEGSLHIEPETLVIAKTTSDRCRELQNYVEEHHPYEVPEIVVTSIDSGLSSYLSWIQESVLAPRDK